MALGIPYSKNSTLSNSRERELVLRSELSSFPETQGKECLLIAFQVLDNEWDSGNTLEQWD